MTQTPPAPAPHLTDTPHLDAKLAELLWDPPTIAKATRGQHGKYANLLTVMDALRPEFKRLRLGWFTRPTINAAGIFVVRWKITDLDSGECDTGEYPIDAVAPQARGSEETYASRYSVVLTTGVTPEGDDDDGQRAQNTRQAAPGRPETARHRDGRPKIPGPDHERLREGTARGAVEGAERTRGPIPPGDDLWAGQPAGERFPDPPEDQPGSITQPMIIRISEALKACGAPTRGHQIAIIESIIGRRISTRKNLSLVEGQQVLATAKGELAELAGRYAPAETEAPRTGAPRRRPAADPRTDPETITDAQRDAIRDGLKRLGISSAAARKAVSDLTGRDVPNSAKLTPGEGQQVLDWLAGLEGGARDDDRS